MNSKEIDKKRLNTLVNEVIRDYGASDKKHVYRQIGASLISMGLEADSDVKSKCLLKPQESFDFKNEPSSSRKLFIDTISREIPAENAEKIGRNFWKIFKEKAKSYICEDGAIIKLIKDGKVNAALEKVITSVLIPMGISGLWIPALATITVGILILILKAGIESLCNLNNM
ncbi:hypothetical protein [Methanobacterium sp.]|uniref:hypothetical protein n=1 Tax=Methanobacterium sp. TaxID=2164 RepID=UPI003C77382D